MNKTGELMFVYQIKNLKTGKVYIGSSKNVFSRWRRHMEDLAHNNHNIKFQKEWNINDIVDWNFSILQVLKSTDNPLIEEQKWIEKIGPDKLLNVSKATNFIKRREKEKEKDIILKMLNEGKTYRYISRTLGCSLGYITSIRPDRIFKS
jgi:group I intron endonuclease